jgi:hypothetical protein
MDASRQSCCFRRTCRCCDSCERLMLDYSDHPHRCPSAHLLHPSLIYLADVRPRHHHTPTAKTLAFLRGLKYFPHHPTFLNFFSLLHQSCVVRRRSRRALCTTCTLHNVHVVLETSKLSLRCAQSFVSPDDLVVAIWQFVLQLHRS